MQSTNERPSPPTSSKSQKAVDDYKWCARCQKNKRRADEFHKNKTKPDGLASYCKPCMITTVNDSRNY